MNFLGKALDAAVRLLQQDFIWRAAPVRQRLALDIIIAGQTDEFHRVGDILIEPCPQTPDAIILRKVARPAGAATDVGRTASSGPPVGLTPLGRELGGGVVGK